MQWDIFACMRVIIPPYLKKGDTIGLVCPAGAMPKKNAEECIRVLREEWGFKVKLGKTMGSEEDIFPALIRSV